MFVASFSGAEDSLSQWCMYGGAFSGVALGFDSAALVALDRSTDSPQQVGFFRVRYEEAEQEGFFEWLVTAWEDYEEPAWERDLPNVPDVATYKTLSYSRLAVAALSATPRMKSRFFSSEQEWRLVYMHNRGGGDREVSGDGQKMHVALDLSKLTGKLPLSTLWLGPAVANDESEAIVRQLLLRWSYEEIAIHWSKIPLRGEPGVIRL
jgi:hypothetical protein